MRLSYLSLVLVSLCLSFVYGFEELERNLTACVASQCTLTNSWNVNKVCSVKTKTCYDNKLCPFSGGWFNVFSLARCLEEGVLFPGSSIGCPNDCMTDLGYGSCSSNACKCQSGRAGKDCGRVSPQNKCSGHGTISTIAGFSYCKCNSGWITDDCSIELPKLPVITPLLPQYVQDTYGENHPLFYPLSQVYITVSEVDLTHLLTMSEAWNKKVYTASMIFVNPSASQMVSGVGIKIRGGVTKSNVRKSYTVDIDHVNSNQTLFGMKTVGLRSLPFDPSYVRDRVIHDLQYFLGVKRTRSGHAQVWINDVYFGLYLVQEQIDKQFLKSRFGDDTGSLYKIEGKGYVDYLGPTPDPYKNCKAGTSSTPCYDAKTDAAQTYQDLCNLATILNLPEAQRIQQLPGILSLDDLYRNLAIEMAIGQTDGMQNGKNFYLYKPTGKPFRIILHDFDMTLGFQSYNLSTQHNIWNFDLKLNRPLYTKTITVPQWKNQMIDVWYQFLEEYAWTSQKPTTWNKRIEEQHHLLIKAALMDKWHMVDYAWSFDEYDFDSLTGGFYRIGSVNGCKNGECLWTEGIGNHVTHQRTEILKNLPPRPSPRPTPKVASPSTPKN